MRLLQKSTVSAKVGIGEHARASELHKESGTVRGLPPPVPLVWRVPLDRSVELYLCAITSISTRPPLGSVLTATAERAGKAPEKCFS